MPSTTTTHYDTVIVGAGPSGLTTAAALARAGVRVLVIEKHPGLSVFPKATGLRPRTMEIMRSWGLADTILRQSPETRLAMAVRPTLAVPGTEVSMGLPSAAELAAVSPSQLAVFSQDRLEAILLHQVREHGGEVWFGAELVHVQQDAAAVSITVRSAAIGEVAEVSASFLVGADGFRSAVRSDARHRGR